MDAGRTFTITIHWPRLRRPLALAVLVVVATLVSCKPAPTPEELKARDDAIARSVQQALEEERAKDRELREKARSDAQNMMVPDSTGDPSRSDATPAMSSAMPATATRVTTDDQGAAPFLARVKRALLEPESMEIREMSVRDNSTALCVEINARTKAGTMTGYTPVIVTADRVLFYLGIKDALGPNDAVDTVEFLKANARLRCWLAAEAAPR